MKQCPLSLYCYFVQEANKICCAVVHEIFRCFIIHVCGHSSHFLIIVKLFLCRWCYIYTLYFFHIDLPIMRCLNAYSQDIQLFGSFSPPFFTFFRPACPCSYFQARLDRRYAIFSIDFSTGTICYARIFSFFSNSMCCYSLSFFSPFLWVLLS